ncbi:hypothetical protein MRX96_032126 [Rhipicephalus microplus]
MRKTSVLNRSEKNQRHRKGRNDYTTHTSSTFMAAVVQKGGHVALVLHTSGSSSASSIHAARVDSEQRLARRRSKPLACRGEAAAGAWGAPFASTGERGRAH